MREDKARARLEPAWEFLAEHDWREHSADGLAVFLRENDLLDYRLPLSFEETAKVERRFHLRPLWPLFTVDGRFYVLALSQKHTRLLSCTRRESREVEVPDMPASIEDALGSEVSDQQLQLHASSAGSRREGIFHGHGGGKDDSLDEERRYLQLIDEPLTKVLLPSGAPLVVAAVEQTRALYSEISAYPNVLTQGLDGNPDYLSEEELRQKRHQGRGQQRPVGHRPGHGFGRRIAPTRPRRPDGARRARRTIRGDGGGRSLQLARRTHRGDGIQRAPG